MKPKRLAIIGTGAVGQSVASLLHDAGHDIRAIISRDRGRAVSAARFAGVRQAATTDMSCVHEAEIILLAVSDDRIGSVAAHLRREVGLAPGTVLVHFSGIHRADILLGDQADGLHALAIHPLKSFPDEVVGVRALPGSPFAIEGEEELLPLAEELIQAMGGIAFRIKGEQKPLYHAAACVASNYLVTLVSVARDIMAACGFSQQDAFRMLTSLMKDTGKNLAALGPENALTGPIARGDVRTVEKHLRALDALPEDIGEIYRALGRKTVELARHKGTLEAEQSRRILKALDE
ncbi:MAG: Rossmann-like and DUF2520 domain-containing protein [Geoalkalibacter sp.]|uniref:Rossmann-like and DUF2520 domain-containing protein n=1 Tax=Geoalkalibacter sp. TaxID=3041440 RepID=UPI002A9D7BF0|nr:Rossmann-like and DUF2520 domain-containing protein [Thermodesulfobacteriota bacterium]